MELTILILILPLLSFLILGIGKWMKPAHAGLLGTLSLSLVTLLSYATAWLYFTSPRTAEGVYETLLPTTLPGLPFTQTLHFDLGILLDLSLL